jgi:hypothetical protein
MTFSPGHLQTAKHESIERLGIRPSIYLLRETRGTDSDLRG